MCWKLEVSSYVKQLGDKTKSITRKLRKLVAILRLLFKIPAGNKLGRHKTGTNLSG